MQSKRKTAAQKRWEDSVRELGCIATRADPAHVQVHHVAGFTYQHMGETIGPWFVLPIHWSLHDPNSGDPMNVTHYPKRFCEKYGTQAQLFAKVVYAMSFRGIEIPFSMDVYNAIMQSRF